MVDHNVFCFRKILSDVLLLSQKRSTIHCFYSRTYLFCYLSTKKNYYISVTYLFVATKILETFWNCTSFQGKYFIYTLYIHCIQKLLLLSIATYRSCIEIFSSMTSVELLLYSHCWNIRVACFFNMFTSYESYIESNRIFLSIKISRNFYFLVFYVIVSKSLRVIKKKKNIYIYIYIYILYWTKRSK